jgi:aminopeptidase N
MGHPDFSLRNPNRVRALLGQFANNNPARFHQADGAGYALLCQQVRELDVRNPQVAARRLGDFSAWTRLEPGRRARVRGELLAIMQSGQASPDVHETVTRLLAAS